MFSSSSLVDNDILQKTHEYALSHVCFTLRLAVVHWWIVAKPEVYDYSSSHVRAILPDV